MKFQSLLYMIFAVCSTALKCDDNSKRWAECGESKVLSTKYIGFINRSEGDDFVQIPNKVISKLNNMQLGSHDFISRHVHPQYQRYFDQDTGLTWILTISMEYNFKSAINEGDWVTAIEEMVDTMNKYKAYQSTINTDSGSMEISTFPTYSL
ncbi:hypothetical protein BB558_005262 [Smittium angustum]|uniref:Uncharacterized protein n=1 Tax=Smittium angustum TaxID=133377 RepID=A0A2U1IZA5_SMIAN|nr:hypothetical protein BB558_005856 [Smittium angustum]PVZ98724.1 hypothetical protein BB558_005262 [Smittium angustum]